MKAGEKGNYKTKEGELMGEEGRSRERKTTFPFCVPEDASTPSTFLFLFLLLCHYFSIDRFFSLKEKNFAGNLWFSFVP